MENIEKLREKLKEVLTDFQKKIEMFYELKWERVQNFVKESSQEIEAFKDLVLEAVDIPSKDLVDKTFFLMEGIIESVKECEILSSCGFLGSSHPLMKHVKEETLVGGNHTNTVSLLKSVKKFVSHAKKTIFRELTNANLVMQN